LAASACFLRGNGRLNCIACHPPHRQPEQKAAYYDARCRSCHANAMHRQPVTGQACASCHMPLVPAGPNLAFTNHRIAVYAPSNPLVPVTARTAH
jgi:hypothetical protein